MSFSEDYENMQSKAYALAFKNLLYFVNCYKAKCIIHVFVKGFKTSSGMVRTFSTFKFYGRNTL